MKFEGTTSTSAIQSVLSEKYSGIGSEKVPSGNNREYKDGLLPKVSDADPDFKHSNKYPAYAIMTRKSNPEVMSICYLRGWCAYPDYMTAREAAAVTDLNWAFCGTMIKHFEEFRYFTGITRLAESEFEGCSRLGSILIPESVTEIDNCAFRGTGLITASTPLRARLVQDYNTGDPSRKGVFTGSSKLRVLTINYPGVIGEDYYWADSLIGDCPSLETLNLPNATVLGTRSIKNLSGLKNLNAPNLTRIAPYGLTNDSPYLTRLVFPKVTSVGRGLVLDNTYLQILELPALNDMEEGALNGSGIDGTSLESFTFPAPLFCMGGGICIDSNIRTAKFENAPTELQVSWYYGDNGFFYRCKKLESVELPESISRIHGTCFNTDYNLRKIICHAHQAPIVDANCFDNAGKDVQGDKILYVPIDAKGYEDGWKALLDQGFTLSKTL